MFGHGAWGLAVAAGTGAAADHSVLAAVIVAIGGVTAAIGAPLLTDRLRKHTRTDRREIALSQQVTQLFTEDLERKDREIERLQARIAHFEDEADRRRRR